MDHLITREELHNILSNYGDIISGPNLNGARSETLMLRRNSATATALKDPEAQ
jgi:hypothetical protein